MTDTLDAIRLTEQQREALLHRLGIPDAIAGCFTETFDDEACTQPTYPWSYEEIETEAWRLHQIVEATGVVPMDGITSLSKAVLEDCITGSTWAACAHDKSEQAARGAWNTLYNLAGKLNQHLGLHIQPGDIPGL